ncbi:hypothetical protein N7523_007555 [Penicillium sp. IBT 18751x]|nr:hypothetical protein N7523_007555 [Penicillium sp. IBT 18751x]
MPSFFSLNSGYDSRYWNRRTSVHLDIGEYTASPATSEGRRGTNPTSRKYESLRALAGGGGASLGNWMEKMRGRAWQLGD